MIEYQNGKKPDKTLDEMTLSELGEINFSLLTDEEEEKWEKCLETASFVYY